MYNKTLEAKVDAIVKYLTCPNYEAIRKEELLAELSRFGTTPVLKKSKKQVIEDYLTHVGIPSNLLGYVYLVTAVEAVIEEPSILYSITKGLYPSIAKVHSGTTASRVERAIRHAIEIAFERNDPKILEGLFGYTYSPDRGKLTNSEFIGRIAQLVQREVENNEV